MRVLHYDYCYFIIIIINFPLYLSFGRKCATVDKRFLQLLSSSASRGTLACQTCLGAPQIRVNIIICSCSCTHIHAYLRKYLSPDGYTYRQAHLQNFCKCTYLLSACLISTLFAIRHHVHSDADGHRRMAGSLYWLSNVHDEAAAPSLWTS